MSRSVPSLKVRVRGLEIEIRRPDGDVVHLCIRTCQAPVIADRDIEDEECCAEVTEIHTVHDSRDRLLSHGAALHLFERLALDGAQHADDACIFPGDLLGRLILVWSDPNQQS